MIFMGLCLVSMCFILLIIRFGEQFRAVAAKMVARKEARHARRRAAREASRQAHDDEEEVEGCDRTLVNQEP